MSPALTLATGVRVLQKVWHDHRTVALMLIALRVLGDAAVVIGFVVAPIGLGAATLRRRTP